MRTLIGGTGTSRTARRTLLSCCAMLTLRLGLADTSWALDVPCDQCDAVMPEEALFCTECGFATAAREGIYCWRCGLNLPSKARYCSRCGSGACTQPHATHAFPEDSLATTVADPGTEQVELWVPNRQTSPPHQTEPFAISGEPSADTASEKVKSGRAANNPWSLRVLSPEPTPTAVAPDEPLAASKADDTDEEALNNSFINSPISLRPQSILLPPRLFDSPTGDILPSLAIHAGAGLGFGFSDEQERTRRWVVSFGLGGAGEAVMASSNITHLAAPESQPLLGLRLRVPVRWAGAHAEEHIKMAFNVAATGDNTFSTSDPFFDLSGMPVSR